MTLFHLLNLTDMPILQQLQIEEAILRCDDRNWLLVNSGSSPAIVMGISGKYQHHVNRERMQQQPIPVIRRFSGGGTVVVDRNTLFYTMIGNRCDLDVPCYPDKLLQWTSKVYSPAFQGIDFALRENDYTIGMHKFGGNAQYITKSRWLHHTSMLWDFDPSTMDYLLTPEKMPSYRKKRDHNAFLCRLCQFFSSKAEFQRKVFSAFTESFQLTEMSWAHVVTVLRQDHRRATVLMDDMDAHKKTYTAIPAK